MTRKYRRGSTLLAGAFAVLLVGTGMIRAGEQDDIFVRTHADLVAILRVRDLFGVNLKVEGLLRRINPHTMVQNPIRFLAARFLHNNRLDALGPGAFFEILLFDPAVIKGNPFVAAFPVSDGGRYLKTLSLQTKIQEEGTRNNITTLREIGTGVSLSMYFGVTTSHIAVFGFDFDAVRKARDLYDQAHPRGMLWQRPQDLLLQMNLSRLLTTYRGDIKVAWQQLRQDIVEDVIGENTKPNHPLGRAIGRAFVGAQNLLDQTARLDASLVLAKASLDGNLEITPAIGTLLADLLGYAPSQKPSLWSLLPPRCVSFQDSLLWPELWLPLVRASGVVAAAGLGNVISQDLRTELTQMLAIVRRADPVEVADCLVSLVGREQRMGPVRVKLVKWRHPEVLPVMLQRFAGVGGDESFLREFLVQNRIDFKLEYNPDLTRLRGARVQAVRIALNFGKDQANLTPVGFIGQSREYLVAIKGQVMAIVTSPDMNDSGQQNAAQRIRLRILGKVLAAIQEQRKDVTLGKVFPALPSSWDTRPMLSIIGCSALRYLQAAANAYAGPRTSTAIPGSSRARQFAREFSAYKSKDERTLILLTTKANRAIITMRVPLGSLRELARACLGISGSVEE